MQKINTIKSRGFVFLSAVLLVSCFVYAGGDILTFPVEKTAVKSMVFSVTINGKNVFTQAFKDIHYIHFAQKGAVTVSIDCSVKAEGVQISPQLDIKGQQVKNNTVSFELSKAGYHVVALPNGERLFVFSDQWNEKTIPSVKKMISVLKYGADSTGESLATTAIQKAINETAKQKRVLYFPAGIYKTGTLTIPSDAHICLGAGALIKGSENRIDYPVDAGTKESDAVNDKEHYTDNGEWMTFSRLLLIDNANNVKIWGSGTIDGSGSLLRAQGKPANLIRIRNSKNVMIKGLVLRDPACWNTHILHSENVTIRDIKMINDRSVPNTDGFDPDASKNVLIDHCFAYCSDDNVAVKTSNNGGLLQNCEDITVSNCVFLTMKSSLKVGTETKGAVMWHIVFQNNYVVEADRGMALYCNDGALFQDIRFIGNYFEKGFPDSQKKAIHFQVKKRSGEGQIKNVLIRDCSFSESFHSASEVTGLDAQHLVNGILFKNLMIGGKPCLSAEDLHLKTNEYVQNIRFEK